jgi:predicted ATPase/DNA-binding CsgD family transcriptional regulator
MPGAVARHYAILDQAIVAHRGVRPVEQGEGDSVVAAFARAGDAVRAALDAQVGLTAEPWPESVDLRVRMALHTGDAQLRDEGNYFGAAVIRCARLRAIGHGSQVLLSRATCDLVADGLPDGVELVDMGAHRLRDLGRPEHVWALAHRDLPVVSEPLRSLDVLPNNLPVEQSSFVGRERELGEVGAALSSTRLLTLTGAGGCGKTRLAVHAAAAALERFPDGVWWVELAALSDPGLLGDALADVLGVRPLPGRTATQAVVDQLRSRRALVGLDNCEHLLGACVELVDALAGGCPEVSVLATSREPLGLPGETSWRVPSLSLPAERAAEPVASLAQSDAVRLFVERAVQVRPNFQVTNETAPAVAQVCQDLDGIPLAIELAAARTRLMSVQEIAAGLADRFRLLTGGARTALPRQQTLRASVDWSHQLLDERESTLLRRLGVFVGGFTLDAAESVCVGEAIDRFGVLDLLGSLVDKSLVQVEGEGEVTRYRLLETVRHYALDHLTSAGETAPLRDRHRDVFLALAERLEPELERERMLVALQLLDADAPNLHAAIEWAARTDPDSALRLCSALTWWWFQRGLLTAGRSAVERALEAAPEERSPSRGRALCGQAALAVAGGEIELALSSANEALALGDELGDAWIQGRSLHVLAWVQVYVDPRRAVATAERCRAAGRAAGDDPIVGRAAHTIAFAALMQDDYARVEEEFDSALEIAERLGNREHIVIRLYGLGLMLHSSVADRRRRELLERALATLAGTGPIWEAYAGGALGYLDVQTGDCDAALARLQRCRERAVSAGTGTALAWVEFFLATARVSVGHLEETRATLADFAERGAEGFSWVLGWALAWLAAVERLCGDGAAARSACERAIGVADHVGSAWLAALGHHELGRLAAGRREWSEAERLLHDALAAFVDGGHLLHVPDSLEGLAEVAAGLESYAEAARLLAAAERARTELGIVRWLPEHDHFDQLKREVRAVIGDDPFEAGGALSLDDAVAYVRRARGSRKRPSGGWESLTPTELDVARHAADGLTNPQIAERLFIAPATVKVHLSHIYGKLDLSNRSQLAAEVTRRQGPN